MPYVRKLGARITIKFAGCNQQFVQQIYGKSVLQISLLTSSVQNNSLSQDIFQRKTLFVSACVHLYGNNVWVKL